MHCALLSDSSKLTQHSGSTPKFHVIACVCASDFLSMRLTRRARAPWDSETEFQAGLDQDTVAPGSGSVCRVGHCASARAAPQGDGDQIYSATNAAMRKYEKEALALWRPLIWQPSEALLQLPPHKGRLFRGINVRFGADVHEKGHHVCWPSFSSASGERAVADGFVKGSDGALFFLQSPEARAIRRFSHFPAEAEVLFLPRTTFQITSALYGPSDIGQFYARIDNVAICELPLAVRSPAQLRLEAHGAPPSLGLLEGRLDTSGIVLFMPNAFFQPALDVVAKEFRVDTVVESLTGAQSYAEVVVQPPDDEGACAGDSLSRCSSASSSVMITFDIEKPNTGDSPCPSVVSSAVPRSVMSNGSPRLSAHGSPCPSRFTSATCDSSPPPSARCPRVTARGAPPSPPQRSLVPQPPAVVSARLSLSPTNPLIPTSREMPDRSKGGHGPATSPSVVSPRTAASEGTVVSYEDDDSPFQSQRVPS